MRWVFKNATLLDGTEGMVPRAGCRIVVQDGKIAAVDQLASADGTDPTDDLEEDADTRVSDLAGAYVVPGLINLHVHLPGNGLPRRRQSDPVKAARLVTGNPVGRALGMRLCESYAQTELMSGVTTIRCVGGLADFDGRIRDRIDDGKALGPRMLVCDEAVSVPGGHMAGSVAYPARDVDDAVAFVTSTLAHDPDWIKLMITGGVLDATVRGEPGVMRMPAAYVRACCDAAHEAGRRVCAHVESTQGVRVALEGGVDTVEHGAPLDDNLVKLFRARGAADVCTLSPAVPFAMFGQDVTHVSDLAQYNGTVVLDGIVSCARTALAAGIPVGLGTDTACPFVTHYGMWRELVYFCRLVGVSPARALHAATLGNAEILRLAHVTGSIEVGKSADMVVVRDNPIADVRALRTLADPLMVVFRGHVHPRPRVRRDAACERLLDEGMERLLAHGTGGDGAR